MKTPSETKWDTNKTLCVSFGSLVVLHDLLHQMYEQEYKHPVSLNEAQKRAFDELCAACEPENDISFSANYADYLRSAEGFLKGRLKE